MQFKVEAEKDGQRQTINVEATSIEHAHERLKRRGFAIVRPAEVKPIDVLPASRPLPPQPRLEQGHYHGAPFVNIATPRRGNSLGVVSLILGIVAFLICWIPLINLLGVPLSALGLLLGLIGLCVAISRKGASIGYPIAGSAVCGVALAVALIITNALVTGARDITNQALADAKARATTSQTSSTSGDATLSEVAAKMPASPAAPAPSDAPMPEADTWASAQSAVKHGDVQIQVKAVTVGKVPTVGTIGKESGRSKDSLLRIEIELTNLTNTKKIDYRSFGGRLRLTGDRVRLTDNFDNRYRGVEFGFGTKIVGSIDFESVYPGKSVRDVIVFEEPVGKVTHLDLELPASHFDGDGMVRLRIPASMIKTEN